MTQSEKVSFSQCCKILGMHSLCIITPDILNCEEYYQCAEKFNVKLNREIFSPKYFDGIKGYNSLCLSKEFYSRFSTYNYMLIYQLDAYVFYDNLSDWCSMGYDYIGAPWFENYGNHENGNQLWAVGNGGFSLRKIDWFIHFLGCKRLYGWKELKSKYYKGTIKSLLVCITHFMGYWQSCDCFLKEFGDNEDKIFTISAAQTKLKPKIPDSYTAMYFAFEQSPTYLFSITQKLPFGCHAWKKYEYESFWKQYIPIQ